MKTKPFTTPLLVHKIWSKVVQSLKKMIYSFDEFCRRIEMINTQARLDKRTNLSKTEKRALAFNTSKQQVQNTSDW